MSVSASVSLKNAVSSSQKLLTKLPQWSIFYGRGERSNEESYLLLLVQTVPTVWDGVCFRLRRVSSKGYVTSVSYELFWKAQEAICLFCLQALSIPYICFCKLTALALSGQTEVIRADFRSVLWVALPTFPNEPNKITTFLSHQIQPPSPFQ